MQIVEHPERQRFTTVVDGHEAELDYQLQGSTMVITHTGVPTVIGGRGVAAALVKAAFDVARERTWTVVPACSYAAVWVRRHPEYADLLR